MACSLGYFLSDHSCSLDVYYLSTLTNTITFYVISCNFCCKIQYCLHVNGLNRAQVTPFGDEGSLGNVLDGFPTNVVEWDKEFPYWVSV